MSNPFVSAFSLFATPSPKRAPQAAPVVPAAPSVPVRVAQWSWCEHVAACDFCEGAGFVGGRICPDCQKRGVRWLGTLPLEMSAAGYVLEDGVCLWRGKSLTYGIEIDEARVLAAMWHVCDRSRKARGIK